MIEIPFSEMMLVCIIALLVLGPEKLPGSVRQTFSIIRKIRAIVDSISNQIKNEIHMDDFNQKIKSELTDMKDELRNDKNE